MSDQLNVLIPLDGSPYSLKILPEVKNLVCPEGTHLFLLRVFNLGNVPPHILPNPYAPIGVFPPRLVQNDYHQFLSQEWDSFHSQIVAEMTPTITRLQAAGYEVTLLMEFGDPAEEILRIINDKKIDLVAMTTHAREGLSRLLLGSVAEHVLHRVNIPILMMHPTRQQVQSEPVADDEVRIAA